MVCRIDLGGGYGKDEEISEAIQGACRGQSWEALESVWPALAREGQVKHWHRCQRWTRRGIGCPFSSLADHEGQETEELVPHKAPAFPIPRAMELAVEGGRQRVGKPAFPIPKPRELFAMARAVPEFGQFLDDIVGIGPGDPVGRAFGIPIPRGELFANAISGQGTSGSQTSRAIAKATGFAVARPGTREDFVTAIVQQAVMQGSQIARSFGVPGIGATREDFAAVSEEAVASVFGSVTNTLASGTGKAQTAKPVRRITGFKGPQGLTSKPNLAARFAQPRTAGGGGFHFQLANRIGTPIKAPRAP